MRDIGGGSSEVAKKDLYGVAQSSCSHRPKLQVIGS